MDHQPNQLSEDNASVWLRVLCKQTFYHLADEPTGNLDSKTSLEIMKLFETSTPTEIR
jgi:putative ABC transport system ATP-binding protein